MQLEGDLREVSVLPLLLHLSRQKFTGAVSFERGASIKIVYLREGDVVGASTNDDTDSIEQILVGAGKISREHAKQAVARRKNSEPISETLLTLGYVTRKEINWARRVQVVGIIRSITEWSEGSYSVLENYAPKRDEGILFHVPQLAVEAIITSTDRERIQRETAGGAAVYSRSADFDEHYRHLGLNEDADRVVAKVDGRRTATELAGFSSEEPFAVLKLLYALEVLGLLERRDKPQVVPEISEPKVTPEVYSAVADRELDVALHEPDIGDLEQEPSATTVTSPVAATRRPWWKIAMVAGVVMLVLAVAAALMQRKPTSASPPPVTDTEEVTETAAPSTPVPLVPLSATTPAPAPDEVARPSSSVPRPEPSPSDVGRGTWDAGQSTDALRGRYDAMAERFARTRAATPYALQIMLLCETASVRRALEIGGDKIWFTSFRFRGKPCYRVFWGSYETRAAAEQAVAEVPGVFVDGSRPVVINVREVLKR